ncbi:hypothetical protein [Bacteroides hominis]|uniref:hypothetical protein n=1 Tax=Bacteroides hominis TaxID=2763023 RepID=UPI00164A94D0|nr:hypothetical protein [Bacteroides hominis (ex Liu et al. 2022)]MBC5614601.1 hypothetical protein [Bacteroides hominis (ex Liu et al. 2022)]
MRDDTAMQVSAGAIFPCTTRPVLLLAAGLGGDAHYRGRAAAYRWMARLYNDTRTRLGRYLPSFNINQ